MMHENAEHSASGTQEADVTASCECEHADNSDEASPVNPNKKKRKSIVIGAVFLLIITAAVLIFIFNLNDFGKTMGALASVSGGNILAAFSCLAAYVIICPLSLCVLCKVLKLRSNFAQNYLIGASEHFFNGITPYQTGAQPFQVFSFSRRKVRAADGTGVIITNFIAQLVAQNLLMLLTLVFAGDFFGSFIESGTVWIPAIGFFMNLLTLAVFLCIATCAWVRDFFKRSLRALCKIGFLKKRLSKLIPTFDEYCDNAQLGAREALAHPATFSGAVGLRMLSLIFYYSIPFFILRSLGIGAGFEFFIYTMFATCFAINAVVWVPTPGTSGGIELSFTILFSLFAGFSGAIAGAAAILWRAITYYTLLLISFLEYLVLELFFKKPAKLPNAARDKCGKV